MNPADRQPSPSFADVMAELDRLISQAREITADLRRHRETVEQVNQPQLNLTFSAN